MDSLPFFQDLLRDEVQDYILENLGIDYGKLALSGKNPFPNISFPTLLHQISGRTKLATKASWYNRAGIIVPPTLNLEQSSSELTATKKFENWEGSLAIDATGGFGIDTMALAHKFEKVIYIEANKDLFEIVQHNLKVLGINNVETINADFLTIQNDFPSNSYLYIDPSRRNSKEERVFNPSEYQPSLLSINFNRFTNWMVKLSPMVSISSLIESFQYINAVHIIDVMNDCKEVNIVGNTNSETISVHSHHFQNEWHSWQAKYELEQETPLQLAEPQQFFYEPWVSGMKSGMYKQLCIQTDTYKLATNTNLFSSIQFNPNFPGRAWEMVEELPFDKSAIQQRIGKKAVVINRNSKFATSDIFCKKYSLVQGEPHYLLLFSDISGKQRLFLTKRLK